VFGLSKRQLTVIGIAAGVLALYLLGSNERRDATEPAANPSQCRVTVTADILNVRAAPALNAPIVGKFKRDAETEADKVIQNGFRRLAENRWAAEEFLAPKRGHDCAVTNPASG
jgi:hypothetical protein